MKLQGIAGKGSGKLGAYVWVVRKGEQIVREYTDKVTNPKSAAQVGQRAKFKLLSQLSAIVAGRGIYFRNLKGGESMRNAFMRANMGAVTLSQAGDTALLNVAQVALTDGLTVPPDATFDRNTGELSVDLSDEGLTDIAGIGYAVISTPRDSEVSGYSNRKQKAEGHTNITANIFVKPDELRYTSVLVWGYRFADATARSRYESIAGSRTEDVIEMEFNRMLREGLIEPTQTIMATNVDQ